MPRKYNNHKKILIPLISGYFNNEPHGPTDGYPLEPAVQYIIKERERQNQVEKDKQLFEQLQLQYQQFLETQKK